MENNELLAYLDHNILDLMTKGDPHKVKELLKKKKWTPIYSDETLKEIHRSKGYENIFLELLEEINAKFIEPILDGKFKQTGHANIHEVPAKAKYEQFLQNKRKMPVGNFGISETLMKIYGGKQDTSFEKINENGAKELQDYILETLDSIDDIDIPEKVSQEIKKIKELTNELPEILKGQTFSMTNELDKQHTSVIGGFEKETGISPRVLNNIDFPDVILKIWDIVSEKIDISNIDLETFFGIKPQLFEEDSGKERTLQEKVNAIYHQLNFLGYYRDSKMNLERRFKASFSDMTHAGIASLCHIFLSRDNDMVMKTRAAFEYLGVKTKILHYKNS